MSSTVNTVLISALFAAAVVLLSSHPFILATWQNYFPTEQPFTCDYQGSTMEVVSFDPLVMYINDFITDQEVDGLLEAGEGNFRSSQVYRDGGKLKGSERTSQSAGLSNKYPVVQCVQSRVRDFLGPTLNEQDDMGTLQLVRYQSSQKFDLHHDWYKEPHKLADGRHFNRPISIFTFLDDNCTEGETYFPFITAQNVGDESKYRLHEDGGVAFKPIQGNAIFWVNLFANGTGDSRTRHAGLPVKDGTKVAMNVWPRKFYD